MTNHTRISLSAEVRKQLIDRLNKEAANTMALHQFAKLAHWNVVGPDFVQLHEQFDKVADLAQAWTDEMAERAATLGGAAEITLEYTAKHSQLPQYDLSDRSGPHQTKQLADAIAVCANSMRDAIELADDLDDTVTEDMFTDLTRQADEILWFIEAHLHS